MPGKAKKKTGRGGQSKNRNQSKPHHEDRDARARDDHEVDEAEDTVEEEDEEENEEDEARQEERKQLLQWVKQRTDRQTEIKALRVDNHTAVEVGRPVDSFFRKLDSSVKKNTAFIKKLKGSVFESQRASLLNDVQKLNLTKYIPETVASLGAIAELNKADITTAVAVASLLHQRYNDFTEPLREAVVANLKAARAAEDKKCMRMYLRYYTELIIAGVFPDEQITKIAHVMENFATSDKDALNFVSIIVSFCKHLGGDVANIINRKQRIMAEQHDVEVEQISVFPEEIQDRFSKAFADYFEAMSVQLVKDHKKWQRHQARNEVIMQLKGELHAERQAETESMSKAYDKLLGNCTTLADLLDADMPELPDDEPDEIMQMSMNIDISNPFKDLEDSGGDSNLWENAEEREFYDGLTDLRAHVPAMLFRVKTDTTAKDVEATSEIDASGDQEKGTAAEEKEKSTDDESATADTEDTKSAIAKASKADTAVDDFSADDGKNDKIYGNDDTEWNDHDLVPTDPMALLIERLPTCVNRSMIDKAAIDFCHLSNKGSRKRLALALFKVKRSRLDLVPFYARLIATLNPGMPDLAEEVVGHLQGEFRFFIRKKIQDNVESRVKNARFLGELTKFKVCPPKVVLNCLQVLMRTFKHHDIDVACTLFESCGRFLFRSADTHVRTKVLLEVMMKKKSALHLDERQNALIDNAYMACNGPDYQKRERKVRPPMHEYLRHLLYTELNADNPDKVLRKLRKFPWNDPEFYEYAVKCFVRVWKVKYEVIRYFTSLLTGLAFYYDGFAVRVIDATLEELRLGMEINKSEYNQRRQCCAKYLAEMYNYRLIDAKVIFNTLYSIITFGVGNPLVDPPTNYFRCKLVCALLDSCGHLFSRGRNKVNLDNFFTYFQRYLFTKTQPLPVDTEIAVYDTLELLRPEMQLHETIEDAVAAVAEIEKAFQGSTPAAAATSGGAGGEEDDDEEDLSGGSADEGESDEEEDEEGGDADADVDHQDGTEEHNEELVFLGGTEEYEPDPEDDAFVDEFNKIVADSVQARRNDKGTASIQKLDVVIPVHLKGSQPRIMKSESGGSGSDEKVVFTLLTRKGAKQSTQDIHIPMQSGLADRMLERQQAEQQERDLNKRFVINYEQQTLEAEERLARIQAHGVGRKVRGRGRRILFSNSGRGAGRGRGFSNTRSNPGEGTASSDNWRESGGEGGDGGGGWGSRPVQINSGSFEKELMRDMGYTKERPPKDYKGTGAVFNVVD